MTGKIKLGGRRIYIFGTGNNYRFVVNNAWEFVTPVQMAATYTAVVGLSVETKDKWKWWILTSTVCFVGFLMSVLCLLPVSIPFRPSRGPTRTRAYSVTAFLARASLQEDLQAVHLLDEYVVVRMVVTSTVLELIGFVWIYGLESLSNDFEFVLGYKLCFVWKSVWLSTPVLFMART